MKANSPITHLIYLQAYVMYFNSDLEMQRSIKIYQSKLQILCYIERQMQVC